MAKSRTATGRKLIAALEEFADHLESGGNPLDKLTVREARLEIPPPRKLTAADVKSLRKRMGVSQSIFAEMLGADSQTVRFWEQGRRNPSGVACRLMEEFAQRMDEDPEFTSKRVHQHMQFKTLSRIGVRVVENSPAVAAPVKRATARSANKATRQGRK